MPAISEETVNSIPAALQNVILSEMEHSGVPGLAVGIVSGRVEFAQGFGVTSVDNPLDVTPDTLFQIGSTTKTVTSLVAMRLVEQGKLRLDEPVITHLPELSLSDPNVTARLTLKHLLTHTAGFEGDYFPDFGRGDDALEKAVASMNTLVQIAPLGEVHSYCNSGFYIVGRLIEVICGKPYETVSREMVLDPIGLNHSFYFPEEVMTHRFTVGHATLTGVHVVRPWHLPRVSNPNGGITSTVRDDLKYARFLMGDGTTESGIRLISRESMDLMQSPLVPTGRSESVGLTWFNRSVDGVRIVRHGGGTNGQTAAFMFAPDQGFAVSIHTNASRPEILRVVAQWVLREYLGITELSPVARKPTRDEMTELAGSYDDIFKTLVLTVEDEQLRLRIIPKPDAGAAGTEEPPPDIPPMGLAISGEDGIAITDGIYQDLEGDIIRRDGEIRWLRLGGRLHIRK